jgi:hypothetical protein
MNRTVQDFSIRTKTIEGTAGAVPDCAVSELEFFACDEFLHSVVFLGYAIRSSDGIATLNPSHNARNTFFAASLILLHAPSYQSTR